MNAKTLLDSRRFCMLMDDLAREWKKRSSTDEERAFRLQMVLDAIGVDEPRQSGSVPATKAAPAPADDLPKPPPSITELDPMAPAIAWAKANGERIAKVADRGDGVKIIMVPTDIDPNLLDAACKEDESLGFFVDTADGTVPITLEGGKWVVPVRMR